jgi:hypothetical protein
MIKNNIKNIIYLILILTPLIVVFMPLFKSFHLVWGDAPFYWPEGLKELVNKPLIWTEKGISFGGKNLALWLSPIMILYGSLNKFLGLNNDLIIRILFYFPSIVFAIVGMYSLTKYLKLSKIIQFFSIFLYLFNTYYLLLIDGGQVGIALAYGVFPLAILFWLKYFDKLDIKSFYLSLFWSSFLCYIDPRITIILYIFLFLWIFFNIKTFFLKRMSGLILSSILLVLLNMVWLLPFLKSGSNDLSLEVSSLQLSSILNSVLLFAPHWPSNIFGKVIQPYYYFSVIPFLIFGGFLFKKVEKKYYFFAFIFLLFGFLTKGTTPPLGEWYQFFINRIPSGAIFRDSSKFFTPLILCAGILIGHTVEKIQMQFKNRMFEFGVFALCYFYLLFLISPSFLDKLNFNLSSRQESEDYQIIYQHLKNQKEGFRTLWFTDKPQMAFETINKPALSASQIVLFKPFSSINNSEDVFNFLNNPEYVDRLRTLGVKYLFLSGDPRNLLPTETDVKNWNKIKKLVENTRELTKVHWGTNMPIYEISDPEPFVFSTNRILAVVGPYLDNTDPSIYLEDGKFDPKILQNVDKDSVKIVLNNSNEIDLAFTFLQKYFKSIDDFEVSEWAVYTPNQYLKVKYELFIRDYIYKDFDYKKGLAFSTKYGEKILFKFDIPINGNYVVAKRLGSLDKQKLTWLFENKFLNKGEFEYEIENKSDLSVLNTIAIIPEDEFNNSILLAESFISKFEQEVKLLSNNKWIIFSQNFDSKWTLNGSNIHLPIYSMINGFYVDDNNRNLNMVYETQKYVDLGVKISLASILTLIVSYFGYAIYKKHHKIT